MKYLVLLIFMSSIGILFYKGLKIDPSVVPSNLIDEKTPNFQLTKIGKYPLFQQNDLKKKEVKIVNFFATWCAPCKKEMPSLEKLAQDLPQIDVYPINMEPPNKLRVRDWLQDIGVVSLNTYFDPKLDLAKKFKLIGMPTTVLLDENGNEFGRIMGEFDFSEKNFLNFLKSKANL